MIYRRCSSTDTSRGISRTVAQAGLILVDILVAISLATLFIITISQSSGNSRAVFEFAKEHKRLLDAYEAHVEEFDSMNLYEFRELVLAYNDPNFSAFSTTTLTGYAHWYGNDRIQTDITVFTPRQSVSFRRVNFYPFSNINDAAGTPLCSVDFSSKEIVGSYKPPLIPDPQTLHPQITPIVLPIDPSLPLTDIEVRNGIAYISTDSAKQSDPDILIVDIKNPAHPELISGLHTGPGISSIALAGNRIFAAVTSRTAQLQVIRIPTLTNPLIESSYKLPLAYATATASLGSVIFFERNLVYLGTEKWEGDEFSIIDVSDTVHPIKIGGLEMDSKVNSILVRNGIAYVAASDQKQLHVVDVHDITRPFLIDWYGPSGWERQEGKTLSFFEDQLALGRTSGGFNVKSDHELFKWGSSTAPFTYSVENKSIDNAGGIYSISIDRSYIYTATRQSGHEIQIFNHDFSTTSALSIALPSSPQTMTCDADFVYVLSSSAPVIYTISFK